ncbi:hypothetical protein HPB48_022269 [Haemaphysalis longicornis]|uniref:Transposable element P transposase-like GTP-binding insertion domain-containing protein n=1 Tax=Haemaphysalis longicornis TaxID=44386 RepID=A0A9J6G8B9_HAELO|nr:hypothetical protein HPB48_022269 [Haemaphysalis longicornis]
MWKVLGIEATSTNIRSRIKHPKDPSRFLHFVSDFPHLIKCLRNNLMEHDFETPDGLVSLDIIREALAKDGSSVTLRVMHGIRERHVKPDNFEKMRVNYAYQLFGNQVLRGLPFFKEELKPGWGSIEPTIGFFERKIVLLTGISLAK